MARDELATLEAREAELEAELRALLVPRDPNDERNVILEVRAGTGGDEAALFAGGPVPHVRPLRGAAALEDRVLSSSARAASAASRRSSPRSTATGAYSRLKYECGVHRVQRVPVTEAAGRIHTSTATVRVLPEADEVELDIDEKDLRIDVYRSSGPAARA